MEFGKTEGGRTWGGMAHAGLTEFCSCTVWYPLTL